MLILKARNLLISFASKYFEMLIGTSESDWFKNMPNHIHLSFIFCLFIIGAERIFFNSSVMVYILIIFSLKVNYLFLIFLIQSAYIILFSKGSVVY